MKISKEISNEFIKTKSTNISGGKERNVSKRFYCRFDYLELLRKPLLVHFVDVWR